MNTARVLALVLLLLGASSPAVAQIPPPGNELQVNVRRSPIHPYPTVGMNARGEFVVAWFSQNPGGTRWDLLARWFAADGTPGTGDILVSSEAIYNPGTVAVAVREDGSFLVASSNLDPERLESRVFAPDGTPLGDAFPFADGAAQGLSAAPRPDGGFLVAGADFGLKVFYRLLGPLGEPLGPLQVLGTGFTATAAANPAGDMVVVWKGWELLDVTGVEFVAAQRIRPDGRRVGPRLLVSRKLPRQVSAPNVALDAAGNFLVVWSQNGGSFARRFHRNGTPLGPIRRLIRGASSSIAMEPQGSFVLVSRAAPTPDLVARRFDRTSSPLGPSFLVNPFTPGDDWTQSVASDSAGNFVVVWSGLAPAGDYGVFARLIQLQ